MVLSQINYFAVVVAGLVYWLFGSLWFTAFFGKTWSKEIEKHGIKIKKPTKSVMNKKFIQTFLLNVLTAFGLALLIKALGITCICQGFMLGLIAGICFSTATMSVGYIWEGRSVRLALIDIGYPLIGIIISSVILTAWQ
jgi:hypothetical protein